MSFLFYFFRVIKKIASHKLMNYLSQLVDNNPQFENNGYNK